MCFSPRLDSSVVFLSRNKVYPFGFKFSHQIGKVTDAPRNPVQPEDQNLVSFDQVFQELLQLCPFAVAASAYVRIYPHRLAMEIVFDGALLHFEGYTLFPLFLGANSTISPIHYDYLLWIGVSGNETWPYLLTERPKSSILQKGI